MRRPLPRLGPSAETRELIRRARVGKKHTEETKAKIAAALRGRKHTPEAREKMRVGQAIARARDTLQVCRRIATRRRRWCDRRRLEQWRLDMFAARELGDEALFEDVRRSAGYAHRRKLNHRFNWTSPRRVSDGARAWHLRQRFYESEYGRKLTGEPPPIPPKLKRGRGVYTARQRLYVHIENTPTYAAVIRKREQNGEP